MANGKQWSERSSWTTGKSFGYQFQFRALLTNVDRARVGKWERSEHRVHRPFPFSYLKRGVELTHITRGPSGASV